jgi:hypothetical protein
MADTELEQQAEATETQQTEQAQQPGQSLSLQDLIVVAQIIQLSSARGAFRAEELQQIGTLYNKLVAFLEATGAISKPASEGTEPTEETPNA